VTTAMGVPSEAVSLSNSAWMAAVMGPRSPLPMMRPSISLTGLICPMLPVVNTYVEEEEGEEKGVSVS
jgi:hypothetical protein